MVQTADKLISRVRLHCRIPATDEGVSDADILAFADEMIQSHLVRDVRALREGFLRTYVDYTLTDTRKYRVPARAAGGAIERVVLVDGNGEKPLPHITHTEQMLGSTFGYYLDGAFIHLGYDPQVGDTIRVYYFYEPGSLVKTDEACSVTAVSGSGPYTYTVADTSVLGAQVDIVDALGSHEVLGLSVTPASTTGTTVVTSVYYGEEDFEQGYRSTSGSAPGPQLWIVTAGETPVVQLPATLFPGLIMLVSSIVLDVLGFNEQAQQAETRGASRIAAALTALQPRAEGQPRKIVNWESPLRWGSNWRGVRAFPTT